MAGAKSDRTHWLYLSVVAAAVAGVIVGLLFPGWAAASECWARCSSA